MLASTIQRGWFVYRARKWGCMRLTEGKCEETRVARTALSNNNRVGVTDVRTEKSLSLLCARVSSGVKSNREHQEQLRLQWRYVERDRTNEESEWTTGQTDRQGDNTFISTSSTSWSPSSVSSSRGWTSLTNGLVAQFSERWRWRITREALLSHSLSLWLVY